MHIRVSSTRFVATKPTCACVGATREGTRGRSDLCGARVSEVQSTNCLPTLRPSLAWPPGLPKFVLSPFARTRNFSKIISRGYISLFCCSSATPH